MKAWGGSILLLLAAIHFVNGATIPPEIAMDPLRAMMRKQAEMVAKVLMEQDLKTYREASPKLFELQKVLAPTLLNLAVLKSHHNISKVPMFEETHFHIGTQ